MGGRLLCWLDIHDWAVIRWSAICSYQGEAPDTLLATCVACHRCDKEKALG